MGHELSVLLLLEVVDVVAVVVTWVVSLALEARTGADAEVIVAVPDGDGDWLTVAILVVMTGVLDAEAVNVRVDVLSEADGVTTVVTTMRLMEFGNDCVRLVTTVTAEVAADEGTPVATVVSTFG